jgi:hypothetical protein
MSKGSSAPLRRRMSEYFDPPGWFAYSTSERAASTPRVPRLMASITSTPAAFDQPMNSCRPNAFVSTVCQAPSRRRGRSSTGPTPSSQS